MEVETTLNQRYFSTLINLFKSVGHVPLAYNEISKFVNFLKFHAVLTKYIKYIFFNIWMLVLTI